MAQGEPRHTFRALISRIGVRPGRRPIDKDHVANLQVSFEDIRQRTPISLQPVRDDDPERDRFTWWLNAGGHRIEAATGLGWTEIDAILDDDDALTATIAEVDENLIRRDYSYLERAQAIGKRLEAYGAKFPDRTTQGDQGELRAKRGRPKMGHGDPIIGASMMGFAGDTAKKADLSRETIKRDLAIYRGIPAGLQVRLLGTPMAANSALLRQLANIPAKDEQLRVAEVLIRGETKSVSDAIAIAAGNTPSRGAQTPTDVSVKAFRKVWADATPTARAAILHDLAGRSLPKGWMVKATADE